MDFELQLTLFQKYPKFFRRPAKRYISTPPDLGFDMWGNALSAAQIEAQKKDFVPYWEEVKAPLDTRGIECGNGWLGLIEELAAKCEKHIHTLERKGVAKQDWPRIAQIKEKFGGLRFYVHGDLPDALRQKIRHVVDVKSFEVCETCGKPGVLREGGWYRTLCDICESDHQAKRESQQEENWQEMEAGFEERQARLKQVLNGRAE